MPETPFSLACGAPAGGPAPLPPRAPAVSSCAAVIPAPSPAGAAVECAPGSPGTAAWAQRPPPSGRSHEPSTLSNTGYGISPPSELTLGPWNSSLSDPSEPTRRASLPLSPIVLSNPAVRDTEKSLCSCGQTMPHYACTNHGLHLGNPGTVQSPHVLGNTTRSAGKRFGRS